MNRLTEIWRSKVKAKQSPLCAGLDPAPWEMGRGEKGLGKGVNVRAWALAYIEAVADFCCALKYNPKYWSDEDSLRAAAGKAREKGLLVIEDCKLADISDTNEAALHRAKLRGADAVTLAPYPGNLAGTSKLAKKHGLFSISMCLMSNPEFALEKRVLHPVATEPIEKYGLKASHIGGSSDSYLPKYLHSAVQIRETQTEGAVIGATHHITEEELSQVSKVLGTDTLILVPGMGNQGGDVELLKRFFPADSLMINLSRALMFPQGSASTPVQQREYALQIREKLKNSQG